MKTNWTVYEEAKVAMTSAIRDHDSKVVPKLKQNTELRSADQDIEQMRKEGILLSDETYVPIRIIDTNIMRELPKFSAYLTGNRLLVLTPDGGELDPKVTEKLEKRHHELLTYPGWLEEWFKLINGGATHGLDYCEVTYDTSKPGHVAVEHIGRENFIVPSKLKSHQQSPFLARAYEVTVEDLNKLATKYEFTGIEYIFEKLKELKQDEVVLTTIYKVYFKAGGVVHVFWYHKDCEDYLKAPMPLDLGIRELVTPPPSVNPLTGMLEQLPGTLKPVMIKEYPVIKYAYTVGVKNKIEDAYGRVFLDKHYQNAVSTGWTSLVNGAVRASKLYVSRERPDSGGPMKLEDLKLRHGAVLDQKVNFHTSPAPNPLILTMLQGMQSLQSQEAGQFNYSVTQKGGKTRPTATEVEDAKETSNQLSSVAMAMFAETVREVYALTFRILQSLAEQDEIFLYGQRQITQAEGTMLEVIENDKLVVKQPYIVKAAGDIDVVQRAQRIEKFANFWPIVAQTPIAALFLADFLKIALPEDGTKYAEALGAQIGAAEKLSALAQLLSSPEAQPILNSLPPQVQEILAEILATYAPQSNNPSPAQPQLA